MHRQMKQEDPDVTVWERYARDEYAQLAMEEEEREREEAMSDGFEDDDNDDWGEVCEQPNRPHVSPRHAQEVLCAR